MAPKVLKSGTVAFKAEGRLLQELGLRLVASPEVALVELIKNAYDAESPDCVVRLSNNETKLLVEDHGQGMTLDDFMSRWMQIATSSKATRKRSTKYKRPMTGAKGIGRFAVRYLGDHLSLETTAYDKERGEYTTLSAQFDWPKLDRMADLANIKVPYKLVRASSNATTGTKLLISKLRNTTDFATSRNLRAEVLRIISPLSGLDGGHISRAISQDARDPGFKVALPGDDPTEDTDLAELVLKNYWAKLTVSLKGNSLAISVTFPGRKKDKSIRMTVKDTVIKNGLFCDIRFFPRRKGVFHSKEVHGPSAWTWVRENSGVAVVDHGFRIKPYGFPDDDWLQLDIDGAHNKRDWRTDIARKEISYTRGSACTSWRQSRFELAA